MNKKENRKTEEFLNLRISEIKKFYKFKPVTDSFTHVFDFYELELKKANITTSSSNNTVNKINDFKYKSVFYYLWKELVSLYTETKNGKQTHTILVSQIKERDIKTQITNIFCYARPLYQNVEKIVSNLNKSNFSSMKNSIHSKYFSGEHDEYIEKVAKIMQREIKDVNPYIKDDSEYNDKIHQLLLELIPFLPTIVFILFPLDYLPVFAFSYIFYPLLRSNQFHEFYEYYTLRLSRQKKITYSQNDDTLINQIPFIHKQATNTTYDIVNKNTKLVFNIAKFILKTRKKLYTRSFEENEDDEENPSYFPFVVKNIFGTSNKKTLQCIDVHYQPSKTYQYYKKLSSLSETPLFEICLINTVNHQIESYPIHEKINVSYVDQEEEGGGRIKSSYHRYNIHTNNEEPQEGQLPKEQLLNNMLLSESMTLNLPNFNSNEYWNGNINTDKSTLKNNVNISAIKVDKPLLNNGQYTLKLRYKTELSNELAIENQEDLLFRKGYYLNMRIIRHQLSDEPLYIGIFHYGQSSEDLIEKYSILHKKKDLDDEDLIKNSDNYVILKQQRVLHKKSVSNPNDPNFDKDLNARFKQKKNQSPKMLVTIEESIGIVRDENIFDSETTLEVKDRTIDSNTITINSPLLHYLQNEYKKCIHSLSKSILIRNGLDYNPYDDDSLRILITGKVRKDEEQIEMVLSVIPLIDFIQPKMTITTHSWDDVWLKHSIEKTNQTPVFYDNHYPRFYNLVTKQVSNLKNESNEYETILLKIKKLKNPQQFGKVVNELLFYTDPLNKELKGFNIPKTFEETLDEKVTDLKISIFRTITLDTGYIGGHNVIYITPFKDTNISFSIDNNGEIQFNRPIEKGTTIDIQFSIQNSLHEIYKKNGSIDKFKITLNKIRSKISKIKVIFQPKGLDEIIYAMENEMMIINTTDDKLSDYTNENDRKYVYSITQVSNAK
jgi:hypothetical protein